MQCIVLYTHIFHLTLLTATFAVAMANFLDLLDLTFPHPHRYPSPSLLLHQYSHLAAMDDLLLLPGPSPFLVFESAVDLIRVDPTPSLSDRVAALELGFGRKYKWTAEVEAPERKYKCVAEVKAGKVLPERKFKWTAEFKEKGAGGPVTKIYTFESSAAPAGGVGKRKKGKDEKKEKKEKAMLVEVGDSDPPALALKQVLAKRKALTLKKDKGKKKELTPQDAAALIQVTFRAHLVRRSKALRELRELAVAKTKLKEMRALFHNFSYRHHLASDAEERQRFCEKIIVLLLTVDAIEGVDLMVRAARKFMLDELEAMLEVVDPQPPGKLFSMRRKFDLPEGPVQK